ncbi:MAG: alpha/beta fold hydrolase [Bacteroidota bacterium]
MKKTILLAACIFSIRPSLGKEENFDNQEMDTTEQAAEIAKEADGKEEKGDIEGKKQLTKKKKVTIAFIVSFTVLIVICTLLRLSPLQDYILFPRTIIPADKNCAHQRILQRQWVEQVTYAPKEGIEIEGLHYQAKKNPKKDQKIVLCFHGNADTMIAMDDIAEDLRRKGYSTFSASYRGYGLPKNKKNRIRKESDLYEDVKAAMKKVLDLGYQRKNVLFFGHSMGGAVSIYAAKEYQGVVGVVTLNAPGSIPDCCGFFKYPVMPLLRYTLSSKDWIKSITGKVTLLHAKNDSLIPYHNMEILAQAAKAASKVECISLEEGDHNVFPSERIVKEIIKSFNS